MEIHGLKDSIAYCEAMGLSKVFKAYADECSGEDIFEIGFNSNSGYVYIALENGVQIASCMGQDVEYVTHSLEDGVETFFNSYQKAINQ